MNKAQPAENEKCAIRYLKDSKTYIDLAIWHNNCWQYKTSHGYELYPYKVIEWNHWEE